MDFNKFTESVRKGLQIAGNLAKDYKHQYIDVEHFLLALLNQEGGLAARIFSKLEINTKDTVKQLEMALNRLPKLSSPAEQYISQRLNNVLNSAVKSA